MNDKDFFIKLHQDYPLAMQYMADNFKCLYTIIPKEFKFDCDIHDPYYVAKLSVARHNENKTKIKHPLKRDLYDFFDGLDEPIYIHCSFNTLDNAFKWYAPDGYSGYDITQEPVETRSQAETEAFTKAFEILNTRLDESK